MRACFVFCERLNVEAEDLGQEGHGQLCEEDSQHPKPEGTGAEGLAEVVGDAGAEGVGQRGEEEVEGAEEFWHLRFSIYDFGLTIYDQKYYTVTNIGKL